MMNLNNKTLKLYSDCIALVLLLLVAWWIVQNFGYAINLTESLPYKVFIIHLNKKPKIGDYVLFKAPINSQLPTNTRLIKLILAGAEDNVTVKGRDFSINDKWVATAKTQSLHGEPLRIGPTGKLKQGQYYVGTIHPDSFDSRYQRMGWITQDLILGVAYPLW